MIEEITTADGDVVLRVDGRLLASRVDPRAEARAFVDARRPLLTEVRAIIVLGLASGHHVAELAARTTAHILVLEPRADVIGSRRLALDPRRVTIAHATDEDAAVAAVGTLTTASYLVLTHPASRALAPDLYRAWGRRFVAREVRGLVNVWDQRGWPRLGGGMVPKDDPLTIHDLAALEWGHEAHRARALIRALKELVK